WNSQVQYATIMASTSTSSLQRSPDHRDLHSFPTRRSSDLSWKDIAWIRSIWPGRLVLKGILDPEDAREALKTGADAVVVSNHGRSEEHTSELQSRENLVCRLLLEKKKRKKHVTYRHRRNTK